MAITPSGKITGIDNFTRLFCHEYGWNIPNVWKKEVTVDLGNETFLEEKPKRVRKLPCSEKMLENLKKGRERRRQLLEEKKKQKEVWKLTKRKRRI